MKNKWSQWSWVLLTAALVLPFSSVMSKEAKEQDCRLKQFASIDLSISQSGRLLVPVMINGRPALMDLHLAGATSGLLSEALEYLSLEPKRLVAPGITVRTSTGAAVQYVKAEDFVIGGQVRYKDVELRVSEGARIDPSGQPDSPPMVGYLGMNILSSVDFELNVAAGKLNLYAQSSCPDQVVYWASEYSKVPLHRGQSGELFFLMELEGKKLQTVMSTSDETAVLHTDASRKLYDFDETSSGTIRESKANSGKEASYYRAMALTNDSMKVLNAKVELRDPPGCGTVRNKANGNEGVGYDGCSGVYPFRLGRDLLRQLRIYIATKENAMYFTKNDAGQVGSVP